MNDMNLTDFASVAALAGALLLADAATAQSCTPAWNALASGLDSQVNTVASWDPDGDGPAHSILLAGGPFATTAAGEIVNNIAQWDAAGQTWKALDEGVTGRFATVYAICWFDEDGAGPMPAALFVGGEFTSASGVPVSHIARWDGKTWSAVGSATPDNPTNGLVLSMLVFDDDGDGPHGPALYVGGAFTTIGGVLSPGIARWDGTAWSSVGGGVVGGFLEVSALCGFDEDGPAGGNPARLFVGGDFTHAGGVAVNRLARWDGESWSAVGGGGSPPQGQGTSGFVHDMVVFDEDGAGGNEPSLYVGGAFNSAGGIVVAGIGRWNGTSWSALSSTVNGPVQALEVFDEDGAGPGLPMLYAGGSFSFAGGQAGTNKIARWDGSTWSSVGGGITGSLVREMVWHDSDGPGAGTLPAWLVVGGSFSAAGSVAASRVAAWRGCEALPGGSAADITGDGVVGVGDLLAVINQWGACPAPPQDCPADIAPSPNGDGVVSVGDLLMVLNNWG